MISLLSPCTLPVIPLLFAGFQGQRKHILALLAGMIVMFTFVAMVVTVASDWIADATVIGRWIALLVLSIAALALIFPQFAQRIASPAVSAGNVLYTHSVQRHGMFSAFLAGLAVGLLWSPVQDRFSGRSSALTLLATRPSQPGAVSRLRQWVRVDAGAACRGGRKLITPLESQIRIDGASASGRRGDDVSRRGFQRLRNDVGPERRQRYYRPAGKRSLEPCATNLHAGETATDR